jgi:hypothetical protein
VKYNRLKKFVGYLKTQQKMDKPRKTEQSTGAELESAFRKPLNVSAEKPSSTEVKPAGPIPSDQASKPVCSTVGLPRLVEQKLSGAMQASNQASRATKEQSKTTYSKENKENRLYNSEEKPDACKLH